MAQALSLACEAPSASLGGPVSRRPAIFISSLSPGYIAGGSQCTLAFLQAVSVLHGGRVHYVGPRFLDDAPTRDLALASLTAIPDRSAARKLRDLVAGLHVDGVGPRSPELLSRHAPDAVVYVNGEGAARTVGIARARGFRTVFIPHNYPAEYLAGHAAGPVQRLRASLVHRWAVQAYLHATFVLTLTDHDRRAFENATCGARQCAVQADMYFGYRSGARCRPAPVSRDFTILIGTNFGLPENERGVFEFIERVWPQVASQTSARLVLAGRAPSSRLKSRLKGSGERVTLVERPSHAEMEEIFAMSSVSVAATREGSGIKLRVAESLRRGITVVCTEHCARGYEAVSQRVLRTFATPQQAVSHLIAIAGEPSGERAAVANSEYDRLFSFEAGVSKLAATCRDILA